MYDPDEDQEPPREVDWEAWAQSRSFGANRWRLVFMIVILVAMIGLYLQSDGNFLPWGPPSGG